MSSTTLQSDFVAHTRGYSLPARLLLTSFRQQRRFTHYTYRLLLWVPTSSSAECVESLKQTIVCSFQELYEREFRSAIRHDFVFGVEDIEVFKTSDWNDKNPPILPGLHSGNNHAAATTSSGAMQLSTRNSPSLPLAPYRDAQDIVKQSYVKAQSSNAISFKQIPREVCVNGLGVGRWDPFELQTHQFRKAELDEEKLRKMRSLICTATTKLPVARDWTQFSEKHNLEAHNINHLIAEAFCVHDGATLNPLEITTTEFGCRILERSHSLWAKNVRAAKLAKLLGCAVMCVSEYIDGGLKHSSGILNKKMASAVNEVPGVQKRSRNIARYFCWMMSQVTGWKGRSIALYFVFDSMGRGRLYELFSITNPAFACEMAQVLSRPEYNHPTTEKSLDIVGIVKCLLRGTVEDRIICDALGCPVTSSTDCLSPSIDLSQDWLLQSLQQMVGPKQAMVSDSGITNDQIGNRGIHVEGCEQQQPGENQQETHTGEGEYGWDNGPLELLPFDSTEADYDPDRGPYSPGAFFIDESDLVLGLFSSEAMS